MRIMPRLGHAAQACAQMADGSMTRRFQIRQHSDWRWFVFDAQRRRSILPNRIEAKGLSLADAIELSELLNDVMDREREQQFDGEPHGAV